MDGFGVSCIYERSRWKGNISVTLIGNLNVIDGSHFSLMKDVAIICNGGYFNGEVDLKSLKKMPKSVKT